MTLDRKIFNTPMILIFCRYMFFILKKQLSTGVIKEYPSHHYDDMSYITGNGLAKVRH